MSRNLITTGKPIMRRRRLTQIFLFLLPLRVWQRKVCFYAGMRFDGHRYSKVVSADRLPHRLFETSAALMNTSCSSLCMDKDRAHKIVSLTGATVACGIRVPRSFTFKNATDTESIFRQAENIGYPLFVKPIKAGSSLGITKVSVKESLIEAVKLAFTHDDEVIVEENINGMEIGCAVLGNDDPVVGEPDEIEVADGFFDYNEKYTLKNSKIHIPARIPHQKADEIKAAAKRIYKALGCSGFARIDMFLTTPGEIVFSETNTIPGFTVNSQYPKMMAAIGMTPGQIISTDIELAVNP